MNFNRLTEMLFQLVIIILLIWLVVFLVSSIA